MTLIYCILVFTVCIQLNPREKTTLSHQDAVFIEILKKILLCTGSLWALRNGLQ